MTDAPTRVLVVDDHEFFRLGVVEYLRGSDEFSVDGEAASAADALRLNRALRTDVILLDLSLPDGSGLDLIPELLRDSPMSRIVVLTANEDDVALVRALRAGASAYILKGIASDEFSRALTAVLHGETYVSPQLAGHLLREASRKPAQQELTAREREVLEGIARSETNREIAERLGVSEKTVKFHVTNVLFKLRARNRVAAALIARRQSE